MKDDEYRCFLNSKFNRRIMNLIDSSIQNVHMDLLFQIREHQANNFEPHKYNIIMESFYDTVRTGDTNAVIEQIDAHEDDLIGFVKSVDLEGGRQIIFGQAYLFCYLAIQTGVPNRKAYSMLDAYLGYIQTTPKVTHLVAILINLMIEFTNVIHYYCSHGKLSDELIASINYMELHMHEKISLTDVAEHVHLSARQLTRNFQSQLGCTIIEYINEQKMEEARYLLRLSPLAVAEISSYLAFSSESYFIRVFKKYSDCTPLEYRNKHPMKE